MSVWNHGVFTYFALDEFNIFFSKAKSDVGIGPGTGRTLRKNSHAKKQAQLSAEEEVTGVWSVQRGSI